MTRPHSGGEGLDVVLTEVAGSLPAGGVGVRCHVPHRSHGRVMDLPDLSDRDQRAVMPVSGLECLPVYPLRRVGVAAYLVVLPE